MAGKATAPAAQAPMMVLKQLQRGFDDFIAVGEYVDGADFTPDRLRKLVDQGFLIPAAAVPADKEVHRV